MDNRRIDKLPVIALIHVLKVVATFLPARLSLANLHQLARTQICSLEPVGPTWKSETVTTS